MSKPFTFLWRKKRVNTLLCVDTIYGDIIYGDIIVKLPLESRIYYCESLIYRNEMDLERSICSKERKKLKNELKIVMIELEGIKLLQIKLLEVQSEYKSNKNIKRSPSIIREGSLI